MKSWAIVVGINEYPLASGQQPLDGAVADACDFAEWVLDPQGGNVDPQRLYFWTYPWPANIDGRLGDYLEGNLPAWQSNTQDLDLPDQARPPHALEIARTIECEGRRASGQAFEDGDQETRRVYVFLAGHGIRARNFHRDEETCFIAGDAKPANSNLATGLVPLQSLRKALLTDRFDEAIMFTDCCRSAIAQSTSVKAQPVSDYDGDPDAPYSIAFAAKDGHPAYEIPGPPARGAFSTILMTGLRSHRPSAVGLTAADLRSYVETSIGSVSTTGQMPNVLLNPPPEGPIIVAGVPAAAPITIPGITIDVSALAVGTQLLLRGGHLEEVPGVNPLTVTGPTLVLPPLPEGLYLLESVAGPERAMFHLGKDENIRVQ